jgi:hypothetical protein
MDRKLSENLKKKLTRGEMMACAWVLKGISLP